MAIRTPPVVSTGNKAASTTMPTTPSVPAATSNVPQEKIAMRAYEKWCQRGCPHGTHEQDWCEAEQELRTEMSRTPSRQPGR